jgi:hypothetical protein
VGIKQWNDVLYVVKLLKRRRDLERQKARLKSLRQRELLKNNDKFPSIVLPTFLGEASNRRTLS